MSKKKYKDPIPPEALREQALGLALREEMLKAKAELQIAQGRYDRVRGSFLAQWKVWRAALRQVRQLQSQSGKE